MLKIVQFGREIFTLSPLAYITVDSKKLVCDLFWADQRKNKAIKIAPKHNNSLEPSPYAIQKHHAIHQSDFTLQIPSQKSMRPL